MSILLSKKDILVVNAKLASVIGLNDAIVLQQLAYWLEETSAGIEHDGVRWIYNTHPQWLEQFPFWSIETVKRAFASLQKRGLIIVKQLAASTRNQTNHYTINYAGVDLLHQVNLTSSTRSNCATPSGQSDPSHQVNLTSSSVKTETTTETTTNTIPATLSGPLAAVEDAVIKHVKPAKPAKAEKPAKPFKVEKTDAEKADDERTAVQKEVCRETWAAFCKAYAARYKTEPLRNGTTNSQVITLVKRIGKDAPSVACFYVGRVNDAFVVGKCHDLGLLVSGYQGYHTQWATGKTAPVATQPANTHKYAGSVAAIWSDDEDNSNDSRTVNA